MLLDEDDEDLEGEGHGVPSADQVATEKFVP